VRDADDSATPLEAVYRFAGGTSLPPAECDPFTDVGALNESYLCAVTFDLIESRVAFLFGLFGPLCPPTTGNLGLLIFEGVGELGWKVGSGVAPLTPRWWTVLANGLVVGGAGVRVEIPALPGTVNEASDGRRFRFEVGLNPDGAAAVSFDSAWYLVGSQEVRYEEDPRVTWSGRTQWHALCRWPR
jgi:hypothetical protein